MSKFYYNSAVEGPFYLKSAKIQYKIQNTIYDLYHRRRALLRKFGVMNKWTIPTQKFAKTDITY